MPQYAWLDIAFGVWHLVTEGDNNPVRFWKIGNLQSPNCKGRVDLGLPDGIGLTGAWTEHIAWSDSSNEGAMMARLLLQKVFSLVTVCSKEFSIRTGSTFPEDTENDNS
jgi:hypothetical protein